MNPNLADVHYYLGNCYLRQDYIEDAIKYYIKSLKLDANNPEGYYNLGNALCAKSKYKEAIKCYKKSILLDVNNNEAHFNLANTYFLDKQYKEALEYYDNCKNYTDKKNQVQFMQARIYIELSESQNDPEFLGKAERIFDFLTSIDDFSKDINCLYYKAILMEKLNRNDKAIYLYKVKYKLIFKNIMNTSPNFEDVEERLNKLLNIAG